jgi:hypothetical protein
MFEKKHFAKGAEEEKQGWKRKREYAKQEKKHVARIKELEF